MHTTPAEQAKREAVEYIERFDVDVVDSSMLGTMPMITLATFADVLKVIRRVPRRCVDTCVDYSRADLMLWFEARLSHGCSVTIRAFEEFASPNDGTACRFETWENRHDDRVEVCCRDRVTNRQTSWNGWGDWVLKRDQWCVAQLRSEVGQ